jgi:hypothetical protein
MSVTEDNIAADRKAATILTAADITFLAYDTYMDGNLTTKDASGVFALDPVEEQLEADGSIRFRFNATGHLKGR